MDVPGQGSVTGHALMRASREDRERVIGVIKTAFVQDRLDLDELAGRVGQALTARTYGQLAALTADLPGPGPVFIGLPGPGPVAAGLGGQAFRGTGAPRAVPRPRNAGQIMARAAGWTVIWVLAMVVLVRSDLLLLAFFALPVPVGIVGYGILEAIEVGRARGTLAKGPGRHQRRSLDDPADQVRAVHGSAALWPTALR